MVVVTVSPFDDELTELSAARVIDSTDSLFAAGNIVIAVVALAVPSYTSVACTTHVTKYSLVKSPCATKTEANVR